MSVGRIPPTQPSGADGQQVRDDIKNKSTQDLQEALNDKNTPDWYKKLIVEELARRTGKNEGAGGAEPGDISDPGGGSGEEDLSELWKKLADGSITDEELEKLAELLGIDAETLASMKGKVDPGAVPSGGGSGGGSGSGSGSGA